MEDDRSSWCGSYGRAFALALLGMVIASLLHVYGLLEAFDYFVYDRIFQLRQTRAANSEVVLLGITDQDLADYGRWPWPRAAQAEIFHLLAQQEPAVVAFDILYTEASDDPEADESLAKAIAGLRHSVAACNVGEMAHVVDSALIARSARPTGARLEGGLGKLSMPIPIIQRAVTQVGHVEARPDRDGSVRRAPLLLDDHGSLYPSLGLQAALAYLGVAPSQLSVSPTEIGFECTKLGTVRIPSDSNGNHLVAFPGNVESSFVGISIGQLTSGDIPELKGKVVVVGMMASGHLDMYPSPVSATFPGMAVHASVLSEVLNRNFLRVVPGFWSWIAAMVLAGAAVPAIRLSSAALGVSAGILLTGAPLAIAAVLLPQAGIWWSPVFPSLAAAFSVLAIGITRFLEVEHQRRLIRNTFGRYLSPAVLSRLLDTPNQPALQGRRKEVSVFFSDIRGFTAASETLEPEQLIEGLSLYLSRMTQIVFRHEGTLDKFIGDAVMVFFNDPIETPDHLQRALRMALEMRQAMTGINAELEAKGLPPISVGMGVNVGIATVGNVGSALFSNYTVIGSCVNLAARLESATKSGNIFVSDAVYQRMVDGFEFADLGEMNFKNIREPVHVWSLLGEKPVKVIP